MSKVFFSVSVSLDGFLAPEGMTLEHAGDPSYKGWLKRWMELQDWALNQSFLRENLGLGAGGETGADDALCRATFARTGATILGKRMFSGGEPHWPEEAPFRTPVFVLTRERRDPWIRPGGTTFYFVNDGIEAALGRAREAAGERDVRIGGGADTIVQYLNAGLVDEFHVAVSPVLFGGGTPLFGGIDPDRIQLQAQEVIPSPRATHLRYAVSRR